MNIEQLFEKNVKIIVGRFVKEVIGSAIKHLLFAECSIWH